MAPMMAIGVTTMPAPAPITIASNPAVKDGAHEVLLSPEQAVTVTDPATGVAYVVAYRLPGPGTAERSRGVHVYRLPSPSERDVVSVHLPWVRSLSDPWGGRAGMGFSMASQALAMEVASVTATQARVRISVDSSAGLEDRLGPAFIGSQPRLGGDGRLRVPRAMDQSGVVAYVVKVNGRVVERRAAVAGVEVWTVRLPRSVDARSSISVEVADAVGNVTLVDVR